MTKVSFLTPHMLLVLISSRLAWAAEKNMVRPHSHLVLPTSSNFASEHLPLCHPWHIRARKVPRDVSMNPCEIGLEF